MSFKFLFDVQRYVSTIAHTEVRPPNLYVSEDALMYTVGRSTLTMDVIRRGIQDAYSELDSLLHELVGDFTIDISLEDLVDDMSNTTRGYSFLSEQPFSSAKHQCFMRVVKDKKLAVIDAAGNFAWNKPACRRWLLTATKFWRTVAWLLCVTAQVSTRLTQSMETTFCNADHLRSIIVQCGEMLLLLRNHKAGHLTERDNYLPGFIPPILARIIMRAVLIGLREAEAVIIYHEHGREAAEIHRTSVNP